MVFFLGNSLGGMPIATSTSSAQERGEVVGKLRSQEELSKPTAEKPDTKTESAHGDASEEKR